MSKSEHRHYEALVVRTDDLIKYLRPWINSWNLRHNNNQVFDKTDAINVTAYEALGEAAGVTQDRVGSIMSGGAKFTAFSTADAFLTCAGLEHLLDNDIPVIPNPVYSYETWIERMKERGCVYE